MKTIKIEVGFSCSLEHLLKELKAKGITDYSKVTFGLDYSDCYYEGEDPAILAISKVDSSSKKII